MPKIFETTFYIEKELKENGWTIVKLFLLITLTKLSNLSKKFIS